MLIDSYPVVSCRIQAMTAASARCSNAIRFVRDSEYVILLDDVCSRSQTAMAVVNVPSPLSTAV
jgi:hypothetical protein